MQTVLITGASSGIGRASALRLAGNGFEVFASVRDESDGVSLQGEATGSLRPVFLDVTDADSIRACASEISEALGDRGLDGLVNNAGAPFPGPLEVLPLEDFRRQLEVNLTGQLAVTQAFMPRLRRARGRIVFVSSLGGRVAFPFAGAYHASKFGLEGLGETLRQELRGTGVRVSMIEPGTADSEIWGKAAERSRELLANLEPDERASYTEELGRFEARMQQASGGGMSTEKVAKAIEDVLTSSRPPFRRPVGLQAQILTRVRPLIPNAVFDALTNRLLR